MHELSQGLNLDQATHIQVLENKLALSAVREAQMESAIQQLLAQQDQLMHDKTELQIKLDKADNPVVVSEEG